MQHKGRYAIYHPGGTYHELNKGERLYVYTGEHWIKMRVGDDFEGYFLESEKISFYPKMVYARVVKEEGGVEKQITLNLQNGHSVIQQK